MPASAELVAVGFVLALLAGCFGPGAPSGKPYSAPEAAWTLGEASELHLELSGLGAAWLTFEIARPTRITAAASNPSVATFNIDTRTTPPSLLPGQRLVLWTFEEGKDPTKGSSDVRLLFFGWGATDDFRPLAFDGNLSLAEGSRLRVLVETNMPGWTIVLKSSGAAEKKRHLPVPLDPSASQELPVATEPVRGLDERFARNKSIVWKTTPTTSGEAALVFSEHWMQGRQSDFQATMFRVVRHGHFDAARCTGTVRELGPTAMSNRVPISTGRWGHKFLDVQLFDRLDKRAFCFQSDETGIGDQSYLSSGAHFVLVNVR